MYIPNDDAQNYPFCILQLVVDIFGHLINQPIKIQIYSPKLLSQQIKKRYYKTFGTSVTHNLNCLIDNLGIDTSGQG